MALSTITSSERTEHLIYAILPFSVGLWILRFSMISEQIGEMLAVLGLLTSLGTIILYELGLEEHLFNGLLKRLTINPKRNLYGIFLKWNLLVKAWVTSLEEIPKLEESNSGWFQRFVLKIEGKKPPAESMQSPYLRDQTAQIAEKTVSSNPIKRRVWRIRGFFYLILSFPFLWVVGIETAKRTPIGIFPDWLAPILAVFLASPLWQVFMLCVVAGLMLAVNLYRHRELVDHIQYLAEFNYLQILIAVDSVKSPGKYLEKTTMAQIRRELESLGEIIMRGYWSLFASKWSRVKTTLDGEAAERFRRDSEHILRELWGGFIQSSRRHANVESRRRQLGWFIHFAYAGRSMLEGFVKSIIGTCLAKAYQESTALESVAKPDVVLDMMIEKQIEKDYFGELAMILSRILGHTLYGLDRSMIDLVEELKKDEVSDLDSQKTGGVLRRYLLEIATNTKTTQFWSNVGGKALRVIVERLPSQNDRHLIVRKFLEGASDNHLIESFDYSIWIEAMQDSESVSLLKIRIEKPREIHDLPKQARQKLRNHGINLDEYL